MRARSAAVPLVPFALLALALPGCDEEAAAGGADGGSADGGGAALAWPAAAQVVPDALHPGLAALGGGTLFTWSSDGKLRGGVAGGTPAELGPRPGDTEPARLLASPARDRALLLWRYNQNVWFQGTTPGAAGQLMESWDVGARLGATWTGARPLVVAESSGALYAYPAPTGATPAPAPDASVKLADIDTMYMHHYGEAASIAQLSETNGVIEAIVLVARPAYEAGPHRARWIRVRHDPAAAGLAAHWFVPVETGVLDFPGDEALGQSWVQLHDLGGGKVVLSYLQVPPNAPTQTEDVYLVRLAFDAQGRPSAVGAAVNVSQTPGQTDQSDDPRLHPTGDGRLWVAWREAHRGPRVALYTEDLRRLALAAPSAELGCDTTTSLASSVAADGTLHLGAVVRPASAPEVHRWEIALPR